MYYLLFYDVVDDYVARRTALRAEHLALAEAARERGDLVLAGALDEPVDGAVLVFDVDDASDGGGLRPRRSVRAARSRHAVACAQVECRRRYRVARLIAEPRRSPQKIPASRPAAIVSPSSRAAATCSASTAPVTTTGGRTARHFRPATMRSTLRTAPLPSVDALT